MMKDNFSSRRCWLIISLDKEEQLWLQKRAKTLMIYCLCNLQCSYKKRKRKELRGNKEDKMNFSDRWWWMKCMAILWRSRFNSKKLLKKARKIILIQIQWLMKKCLLLEKSLEKFRKALLKKRLIEYLKRRFI